MCGGGGNVVGTIITVAAVVTAIVAPELIPLIGEAILPAGAAAADTVVAGSMALGAGTGAAQSAASGGNVLEGALTGAGTGMVTAGIGQGVSANLPADLSRTEAGIIRGAATGAGRSAFTGRDPITGAIIGAAGGGASGAAQDIARYFDQPDTSSFGLRSVPMDRGEARLPTQYAEGQPVETTPYESVSGYDIAQGAALPEPPPYEPSLLERLASGAAGTLASTYASRELAPQPTQATGQPSQYTTFAPVVGAGGTGGGGGILQTALSVSPDTALTGSPIFGGEDKEGTRTTAWNIESLRNALGV